ncbi:dienelactone hydrolase [Paenibacillus taihuensis]|uniref:Dienelactone hydrolase n=1 Tax=Paenibacillus taihuensis TaxID=1156355 RepID=A0A3D9S9W0_9BACL|nr:alpha/beta hydrolase family protein [Paenibacillus taihuensis]REE85277.1 dienelactone hydrolase [Paenibacillus taihuensis]
MWNPDEYLESFYNRVQLSESFAAETQEEWQAWRERLRGRFVELLGGFPSEAAELQPELLESVDCGSYTRQRIQIQTYSGLFMPVYVLIPKSYRADDGAVIALHGHGYGSKDIVGLNEDGTTRTGDPGYEKDFAVQLVERGFLTVAPELFGFGDRRLAEDSDKGNSCHRLSTFLLAMGQTMSGYRVYETLRCVDYLLTRDDVDAERIGAMGISGGGLVASFAAAVDDRISAVVVSGYANTFQASILTIPHCVDNFVPGLSLVAEMPDLLALIAPKPMLLESGTRDPIFPEHAVRAAYEKLRGVYGLLGVEERIVLDLFEGEHEISGKQALAWLQQVWGTFSGEESVR